MNRQDFEKIVKTLEGMNSEDSQETFDFGNGPEKQRCIPNKVWKFWALECTKHVYPIWAAKYPEDKKVWDCLVKTEEFLNGKCSREELIKAKDAAYGAYGANAAYYGAYSVANAAYAAANAANAAAFAAAYGANAAVDAAARAAENREEEENWQRNKLLEILLNYK